MRPVIGITCNFLHPAADRKLFKNKRLMYIEQGLSEWVAEAGGIPVPIVLTEQTDILNDVVANLDRILLAGGADVSPPSYGEQAQRTDWNGDAYHDEYEIRVIKKALELNKPILGICRGIQILNVALGGTLHQDVNQTGGSKETHRDAELYDNLTHRVVLEESSRLSQLLGVSEGKIVSVHHQAIKDVAPDLKVVGRAEKEGLIEAVEWKDDSRFVMGVQWHPEWTPREANGKFCSDYLPSRSLIEAFVGAKD